MDGSGFSRLKILVSLVRFQFWPYFSKKNWPESKPPAWFASGIEVRSDVFCEAKNRPQPARWTGQLAARLRGFQLSGIEVKRPAGREPAFRTTTRGSAHRLKGFQFPSQNFRRKFCLGGFCLAHICTRANDFARVRI
jgi:hypothetical protein